MHRGSRRIQVLAIISQCYEASRRENLMPSVGRVETKTANLDENHRWGGGQEEPVDVRR